MRPLIPACLGIALWTMALAGCDGGGSGGGDTPATPQVAGGDAKLGLRLLDQYQCGACHRIPGVPAALGQTGPELATFGKRSYIAGQFPNQPDLLQRWIIDPPALKPGTVMPAMGVSVDEARHMAAYLYGLP